MLFDILRALSSETFWIDQNAELSNMNISQLKTFQRRLTSISVLVLLTLIFLPLSPFLIPAVFLISKITRYSSLIHALLFFYGYLFFECMGVLALTKNWLMDRREKDFLIKTRNIQNWWGSGLLKLGKSIYKLEFQVSGEESICGPSAILMPRHTSLGDTVLPIVFFGQKRNEGLRYILKKELLMLPCLDIAGNRLPNLFIDRSGQDTSRELNSIVKLLENTPDGESLLIYPEGTRSSQSKRDSIRRKNPRMNSLLERWPSLLPPRTGGPLTLLKTNAGKDVVFMAHLGFEGSASLEDLINGSWLNQAILIHFWRVPFAQIPEDKETFLYQQWDVMQRQLNRMQDDQPTSSQ